MENETSAQSGFGDQVATCIARMLEVGFDASAFETAKWVGIGCVAALGISATVVFAARLWKGQEIKAPISENQFRWLLYVGALLIALPVVAKITTDNTTLNFASADRDAAHEVCLAQANAPAQQAEISGLEAKISVLEEAVSALQNPEVEDPDLSSAVVVSPIVQAILGLPVTVYHRSGRKALADEIENVLSDAGAGVALRATDLSETSRATTATAGEIYVLTAQGNDEAAQEIRSVLGVVDIQVQQIVPVASLSGTPVQILIY